MVTTNPAPPVDDACVTLEKRLDGAIAFYAERPCIDADERSPSMEEMSLRERVNLRLLLKDVRAALAAPSPTADEARTLLKLIEMRCLSRSLRDSTGDIDLLKRAAALLSRVPSEEATEEDIAAALFEYSDWRLGLINIPEILARKGLRISRAPGAGT